MPVPSASAKKPAVRMSEMRLEIVIVKKSLEAANAITVGKISNLAMSIRSMVVPIRRRPRPAVRPLSSPDSAGRVAEIVGDLGEGVLQVAAERIDHRDDGDRDPGDDQAIFDGRRAALVAQKTPEQRHPVLPQP